MSSERLEPITKSCHLSSYHVSLTIQYTGKSPAPRKVVSPLLPSRHRHSNSNMTSPNMDTTVKPINDSGPPARITTEDEANHPASSPALTGDIPNPTITQQRRNGDPMDWKSWPTGRPGLFVSEAAMSTAMHIFHLADSPRDEWSRTEGKVLHVAEFSSTGRSEFGVCRSLV